MTTQTAPPVTECTPQEAWEHLQNQPSAQLVDVRTRPEWSFVGVPDLTQLGREAVLSEWRMFPDMAVNTGFADALLDGMAPAGPSTIFFLCRSGARSMEAAQAVARASAERGTPIDCVNIAEGFEGDLDQHRHRGHLNGWKARRLPWRQS
ncbi:MAG: rhodanese-like domain-containing protein [Pseudomonadota bacterium]